jgi:hypothetical protein
MAPFEPLTAWDPAFLEGARELEGVEAAAARFRDLVEWPSVEEIDLRLEDLAPVRFALQPPKTRRRRRREPIDADALYDGRITLEGVVPTRSRSWHDFMNALVWASFPESKRALHARQYAAARARIGAPRKRLPGFRTAEEDALTMLDEGGEVVLVSEATAEVQRYVFGHALLEHALKGQRSARAKELRIRVEAALPAEPEARGRRCDDAVSAFLRAGGEP